MNPKLKAALYPILAALLGALSTYFATGCSGAPQMPAMPPEVPQALEAAKCVQATLDGVDLEALTLREALDLGAHVKACLKPAPAGDAGAQ